MRKNHKTKMKKLLLKNKKKIKNFNKIDSKKQINFTIYKIRKIKKTLNFNRMLILMNIN